MTTNHATYNDDTHGNKLYRSRHHGVILGVCAGLADYFGFDRTMTRVVTIIGAFLFAPTVIIAYVLLGLLLRKAPDTPRDADDYRLKRRIRAEPHSALRSVKHRFRELDRRMQRLERIVTSKRFRLEREFDGLKD